MYPYKELPVGKEVELYECTELLQLQHRTDLLLTLVRPRTYLREELHRIWWEIEHQLNMVGWASDRTMAMYAPHHQYDCAYA